MDILTLELFEVTVSEALREIDRAAEAHPDLPLRILLGSDRMLRHNVQRLLVRLGRQATLRQEGTGWRLDVAAPGQAGNAAPGQAGGAAPDPRGGSAVDPAPPPALPPLLVTRSHLGPDGLEMGRRLLLGVLRELDPAVPWLGLALGGLELLADPQALAVLEQIQARGTKVQVSREGLLFVLDPPPFEVMEDSQWQRLAGRGALTIL
jgi:hypothetical protein